MFPPTFRLPRRLKVLFWKLTDRVRKPTAEPLSSDAADGFDALDAPAFVRHDLGHTRRPNRQPNRQT
jgi:hypothetical protein